MSRVVVAKIVDADAPNGMTKEQYRRLLTAGLRTLAGKNDIRAIVRSIAPRGVVGMKTNCLARQQNSTPVALTVALGDLLVEAGIEENNIIVWDRTNRELQDAGYTLNASVVGRRCLGTDTRGFGYSRVFFTSGDVDSLVAVILARTVDVNINLPVLKDHSLAGMSGALKNMYGAIHNPNKFHDNNCSPFCAHVNNLEPIRAKNRLTVLDAVNVQYHGGPGYVGSFVDHYGGIVISDDPVACDRVGLEVLRHFRAKNGQPPLEEAGRPVKYLNPASQLGLGEAELDKIDLRVVTVLDDGTHQPGELLR